MAIKPSSPGWIVALITFGLTGCDSTAPEPEPTLKALIDSTAWTATEGAQLGHAQLHGQRFSVIMGTSRIESGHVSLYTEERSDGTGEYPLSTRKSVEGGGYAGGSYYQPPGEEDAYRAVRGTVTVTEYGGKIAILRIE